LKLSNGRFGFVSLADVASLPLLIALAQTVNLALMPAGLAYSRHIEHQADRFSLELTHDNLSAARAFVKLQQTNLGYPRPGWFYTFFRASHPSLGDRIDFANTYRPWADEASEPEVSDDLAPSLAK
jgi:Zn-dependent protease with chaperone function